MSTASPARAPGSRFDCRCLKSRITQRKSPVPDTPGEIRILVVDDSPDTLEVFARNLGSRGYAVLTARSVAEATRVLDKVAVDLVITDYKMPQVDGLDLVQYVHERFADIQIIMITGYPSINRAVQAVRLGATDYLEKPFTDDELFGAVDRALDRLHEQRAASHAAPETPSPESGLVGESDGMREVYRAVARASTTVAHVLITGESGTGKELVARAIHYGSDRAGCSFVPVNCGGIPEGLLESELFGHVKGSFTGATESRIGFFQAADGGTLFLDEISETSMSMQVKLLRVLQDKEISLVGSSERQKVDVRIVAATNKDLESLVAKGRFREDLFFRLSVLTINVPPLRSRENDILLLAGVFAQKYAREVDRPPIRFDESAIRVLKNYAWPGNVRELENVVQRLTVMSDRELIEAADLPALMKGSKSTAWGELRSLAEVELEHVLHVLHSVKGNKTRAAEILGIDRKTLREKLKGHNSNE
ncbi:response regulator [candidate division GN15 bacterium]|nr:response regulator [candidate division GN15 bacterium]